MDSSLRAELDTLRSRAYGRSADDALDTETVRRLQELEARAREDANGRGRRPTEAPEPVTTSGEAPTAFSPATSESPTPDVSSSLDEHVLDRRRRSWRRPGPPMLALWAASVATSTAIASAATFAVVGFLPVAVVDDAPQIASLEPDAAVRVPIGFFGAGASSATYEFHGLTMFETSSNMTGYGGGGECFVAALTSDIPEEENVQGGFSTSGPFYSGCRVGNFPATITIAVDSAAPSELRTMFPDGALRFIKDGERIGVFLGAREG